MRKIIFGFFICLLLVFPAVLPATSEFKKINSDYTIEKNSIRFPGQFFIQEAYITPGGTKILLAEIVVHYDDYRFFSVGVDVNYNRS